jgi:uncharacterized membrane protein YhaH (DUF805 family)
MNGYLQAWQRFAEFSGRSRRLEYWVFLLIHTVILLVLCLAIGVFGLMKHPLVGAFCAFLAAAYFLAALIPSLAAAVRRLHDTGRSGWWVLLGLIPIVDIALLVLLALDTSPSATRYGPDPRANELPTTTG